MYKFDGFTSSDGTYHEGLVDCSSMEEYDKLLASMKEDWNQREQQVFSDRMSYPTTFFLVYTVQIKRVKRTYIAMFERGNWLRFAP